MPGDVNGAAYIDFSDPARMFIGRALTKLALKPAKRKKRLFCRLIKMKLRLGLKIPQK